MILKEILEEIKARYSSDFEEDNAIIFINSALRQFGRYIGRCQVTVLKPGNEKVIELPPQIKPECVKGVFCNGRELTVSEFGKLKGGDFALEPGGKIMFADGISEAEVHHSSYCFAQKRDDYTENFDEQDIGVDDEYAGAVIFAVISDFCEATEDIAAANNYRLKSEEIIKRAKQGRYQKRGKYPVTKDVYKR